jgi:enterochelin esterase-like enzyme
VQVRRRRPTALVIVLLVAIALAVGRPQGVEAAQAWPRPIDLSLGSDALRDEIGLRVYLPPGYRETASRYPVIYFLHGLPASGVAYQSTNFLRGAMSELGRGAIVVAIQGARDGEPDSEYLDSGPGHNWETAVATEVPRFVDAHFRTIAARRARAIVGLSAGGYGAMLIGLHHLETFAVIESWSGYFHPTDVTGKAGLDLGSRTKNARASAHSFVGSLRRSFARESTLISFYVGSADKRFRSENELLDRELTAEHVPHLFRVYPGAHMQRLWTDHAPAWLGLALDHLATPR